jgi:electron transport complex protein RnfC
MLKRFKKGGIHPPENKLSAHSPVEVLPLPSVVVVPLTQHIGAPAVAEVAKGDRVVVGQLIARAGGFVSANVHSPVSGVVTAVDAVSGGSSVPVMSVTIGVEGDEWLPGIDRSTTLVTENKLSPKEIVEKIAAAGIVGMGGATFPTQVKLTPPQGKAAEVLIINGVECEPYLTSDHRVMLERAAEVLVGTALLARALGVSKICIGIENNKPDEIGCLKHKITEMAGQLPDIEIVPLRVQYPQGGEKQLIKAVTGREVPSCALPIDVGCVVQNVGTALAVYEAVQKNKPLVERVVTVTGKGIAAPANFLVRIGTPISTLIEAAGGVQNGAADGTQSTEQLKVINGGPMMGRAMSNPDAPVTKGTSGVLVLGSKEAARCTETDCIKCAKCVTVCPMGLEPYLLSKQVQKQMWPEVEGGVIVDCIECGSCAYICPARIPLLDWIRLGKTEVGKIIRARQNK